MNALQKISEDLISAMKTKDEFKLSVLRMLKSALKNAEIALGHNLSDSEVNNVLEKQAKQRRDSVSQYISGGRQELANKEARELAVIETYLPAKMSRADLEKVILGVISGFENPKVSDMGQIIKLVIDKTQGAADGRMVSEIVKENLN